MRQLTLTVVTGAAMCGVAFGQAPAPLKGTLERVTVHGISLEGNLEGDSPDRAVSVYLPPSYRTSPGRRYPVVYILHGFTDSDEGWFGPIRHFVHAPASMEAALDRQAAREMILVMPNAVTRYAGSFYGSSAATGDWETFVTRELVAYIDARYRTLASPASRGLAGHSMGGYGAIRLAMKYPEVFSSVYAMSACCLVSSPASPETMQKAEAVHSDEDFSKADFGIKAIVALAAAWSPNPTAPMFFDLPFKDGQLQPSIVAQWSANSPATMVGQYAANLRRLRFLAFDIGLQDGLLGGNQLLDRLLTEQSVPHTFQTYEGTHIDRIAERLETSVLPFFTEHLVFDAPQQSGRLGVDLDHVILGVSSLARGIPEFARLTGVVPKRGGRHPGRGTENALVSLGEGHYLELFAPIAPGRDSAPVTLSPAGWALHTPALDQVVAGLRKAGFEVSGPDPGSRLTPDSTLLRWRTAAASGPGLMLAPFFIEWGAGTAHPSTTSPGGCRFVSLELTEPEPARLQALFQAVDYQATVNTGTARSARLTLDCPRGRVTFAR